LKTIENRRRGGSVELVREDDVLLVRPRGYIGRRLIKDGFREATAFGNDRPGGWWHVTDTTRVRLVHPLNPVSLRGIQKLPNIRGYVVIAPSRFVRFGVRALRWLMRQDAVVRTEAEARAWIASHEPAQ
jgi:hypothetical protein